MSRGRGSGLQGLVVVAAVAAVILGFIAHNKQAALQTDVVNAGYTGARADNFFSISVKAQLHGCGFSFARGSGPSRTVNGHTVQPFTISLAPAGGKAVPLSLGAANSAAEVSAYMAAHKTTFAGCYHP